MTDDPNLPASQEPEPRENPLELALLDLTYKLASVAPRDVAVMVTKPGKDWRNHLKEIRSIAKRLEAEGTIVFLRKGKPVKSEGLKGVYRLARAAKAGLPPQEAPDTPDT